MDVKLNDLPPAENSKLLDAAAENTLLRNGNKYGQGVGDQWVAAAKQASQTNNIPLHYITDTINRENPSYDPTLKSSSSSATGLGQITEATAQDLNMDPNDPIQSIHGVATRLAQMRQATGTNDFGELTKAYVLGPGGYKQYVAGGSPAGADQIPAVNAYLQKNNLLSANAAPLASPVSQAPQQQSSPLAMLGQPSQPATSGLSLSSILSHSPLSQLDTSPMADVMRTNMQLGELKAQRDNLINSTEADI